MRKIFSHDEHNSVFVATKMILVAAPFNATTENCLSVAWRTAGVAGHTGSPRAAGADPDPSGRFHGVGGGWGGEMRGVFEVRGGLLGGGGGT